MMVIWAAAVIVRHGWSIWIWIGNIAKMRQEITNLYGRLKNERGGETSAIGGSIYGDMAKEKGCWLDTISYITSQYSKSIL